MRRGLSSPRTLPSPEPHKCTNKPTKSHRQSSAHASPACPSACVFFTLLSSVAGFLYYRRGSHAPRDEFQVFLLRCPERGFQSSL